MKYSTHIATSLLLGYGIASILSAPLSLLYYAGVALGALLPDIDTPSSYIGRRFSRLSRRINRWCGHRGATHSLIIWSLLFYPLLYFYPVLSLFGVAIGYLGHIVGDYFSISGVPLFHPFSKRKFSGPIRYRTGGKREALVLITAYFFLFYIGLSYFQLYIK